MNMDRRINAVVVIILLLLLEIIIICLNQTQRSISDEFVNTSSTVYTADIKQNQAKNKQNYYLGCAVLEFLSDAWFDRPSDTDNRPTLF